MIDAHASEALADFATSFSLESAPVTTREAATLIILDTLGVILASSGRPELTRLQERLPTCPAARLIGADGIRTESSWAAFANAVAGSFLELDQGERPTGHPALHILPSVLAHSEAQHANGMQLLEAFVVGYEIQSRIAHAFALRWPLHPHGTLGTPAAAAALAKLDVADRNEVLASINTAASLTTATSWKSCIEGATTRNVFAGMTTQAAFLARTLVQTGFTTASDTVNDTFGIILGTPADTEALYPGVGSVDAVHNAYVKFHAACALAHPALDAILDAVGAERRPGAFPPVVARRTFAASEVDRVVIRTTERAARLDGTAVNSELAAKFSIPFAVATLLVHGTTEPASFSGRSIESAGVQKLSRRVRIDADAVMTAAWPSEFGAEASINLTDGTILEGRCTNPYGSNENPPSRADVRAKLEFLAAPTLTPKGAAAAWETGMRLAEYSDVNEWLDDLLAGAATARNATHRAKTPRHAPSG